MRMLWMLGIGLLCPLHMAAAQDVRNEQNKLMAKRAAEADAYRKLAQVVYGLQINSRTYVKDFVAESDDIRGDVDAFIRGIRLGEPVWLEDGSCEVPAEVTVAKVVETLRTIHQHRYKGDDVKISDYESITRRIDKQIFRVVGTGAPRMDEPEPPPLSAPPADPRPAPRAPVPDLWRKLPAQARLMALQAARMDAQRRLAERIKGLRLTARTQVRDFVAESDVITTDLQASLVGAREVRQWLRPDELIAEVTLVVPTEQVVDCVKQLHSRHYKGDDVRGSDIDSLVRTVVKKDFEATGMGVPPPRFLQVYVKSTPVEEPEWIMANIEAEGQGTDPELHTPQGKLKAARAAEMDARRKLAERIGGLRLNANTTVRDFTTQHDEVVGLVDAVIVDALITNTRFENDAAIVTVTVPGLRVWSTLGIGHARGRP